MLFLGCVGAVASFQYYEAFAGLALSWLCYLADGIRLAAPYSAAAMSGATFGRKGAAPDPDLAARRAAFLAAERARAAAPPSARIAQDVARGLEPPAPTEQPYVSRKTMGTAYLLWFFLGGVSAHRFYLGYRASAIIQLLLTPISYAMMMSKSPSGLLTMPIAGLWVLIDAFLIPGMVNKANERARELSLATTFA